MFLTFPALCQGAGSQTFIVTRSFVVPVGVSYVRAVVVGGGGGGTSGHQPGGGGGYVNCSNVSVTSGQPISVIVGAGGTGAAYSSVSTIISNNTAGNASSFGSYLVAGGGSSVEYLLLVSTVVLVEPVRAPIAGDTVQ